MSNAKPATTRLRSMFFILTPHVRWTTNWKTLCRSASGPTSISRLAPRRRSITPNRRHPSLGSASFAATQAVDQPRGTFAWQSSQPVEKAAAFNIGSHPSNPRVAGSSPAGRAIRTRRGDATGRGQADCEVGRILVRAHGTNAGEYSPAVLHSRSVVEPTPGLAVTSVPEKARRGAAAILLRARRALSLAARDSIARRSPRRSGWLGSKRPSSRGNCGTDSSRIASASARRPSAARAIPC